MPTGHPERLLGDVGGTHARFALHDAAGLRELRVLRCDDFPGLREALQAYLAEVGAAAVREGAIAIANPVQGDALRMTNRDWAFSVRGLRRELGWERLQLVNDFTALALALPRLGADELEPIGGGTALPRAPLGVLGAGTGLGMSGLVPTPQGGWVALAGEGGHRSFAPGDADEVELWRFAAARFGHVSVERIVSGPGLELIHAWLEARAGLPASAPGAARIAASGAAAEDALCAQALQRFCAVLGGVAADLALTLGARGGIYIGGGIVPRLGAAFAASAFRARFEAKGRFSAWLREIPVWVVRSPQAALRGAAQLFESAGARPGVVVSQEGGDAD
jgi:glucokinase